MGTEFNWRTGEEPPEKKTYAETTESPSQSRNGRLKFLFGLLLAVAALSLIGWLVLRKHLESTEAALKEEVLTSHNLLSQAVDRKDSELFHTVLSGRDSNWTASQAARMERSLFTTPISPSVVLQLLPGERQTTTVSLDPQHREATVLVEQLYIAANAENVTQTITLQHTYVYRRAERRWLLSPPDPSFWGGREQISSTLITLDYPQRDAEIAQRLTADLDAKLSEMCQIPIPTRPRPPDWSTIGCPADLNIQVQLSTQPDSLLSLADREQWVQSGPDLVLPAPTLVGIPTSEAAYQALFRDYAARVLSAVITHLTGYNCCLYRAVLDKQLNRLGVTPWPLNDTDPLRLLSHFAPLLELEPIWLLTPQEELSEPERLFQYLFVDLLLEEHGFQPADLLTWRQNLIAMLTNAGSVEALWWNYIKGRAAEAQAQAASRPSSPWPEQDLYLACRDNNLEFGLYRYNPRTDTWTKERSLGDENAALMPLPDDSGLVISTGVFEPETFILLPDGTEIPISPDAGTISLPAEAVVDPGGRYLLLYHTSPTTFNTVYLDTNSCDGSGCSLIIAAQLPVWSPDGAQVLLWSNGMLQRGETMEGPFTSVASGGVNSHFWRDNNTPGYVAGLGDRVLLVTGNNASPEVWLNAADLISAAPPELQQGSWKIQEVYPTPDTNAFLVSATVRGGQTYHLFLVREDDDNESETVDGLPNPAVYYLTAMPHQPQSLHVSPDGQWLAVPVFKEESSNGQQFIIYNLHVPEQAVQSQLPFSMTTHNLDWSADGRWLARIGDGLLEFIGTAEGTDTYNHYAFYDDLDCRSLAWVGAAQD